MFSRLLLPGVKDPDKSPCGDLGLPYLNRVSGRRPPIRPDQGCHSIQQPTHMRYGQTGNDP